jgi:N-acetylmuramoyl-L-alanine amidase
MRYVQALDGALLGAGHAALLLTDGTYRERSLRAKKREVSALLNCHVNAGLHGLPGQRSEIYYWPRSVKGLALANDLADALKAVVPWQDVRVTAAEVGPRLDETRAANVRACIDGAVTPSICVEPFFCDAFEADQILSDGTLDRIGSALAQGLIAWGKR